MFLFRDCCLKPSYSARMKNTDSITQMAYLSLMKPETGYFFHYYAQVL
jgi:hypothetical protein